MKFTINYSNKGSSATYDTVKDYVIQQIQKMRAAKITDIGEAP